MLEERLKLLNGSKILNTEQKKWINDLQLSLQDDISTNQRAVVVDNLRRTFEQRLNPAARTFGEPWENLTAVVRRNLQDDVVNVSERLRLSARKRTVGANASKFVLKHGSPAIALRSTIKDKKTGKFVEKQEVLSFDEVSNSIASNQKLLDEWTEKEGLKLALKSYTSGKAPLRTYFLPPSQTNPLDFKKNIIKKLDKVTDRINIPARAKKAIKETTKKWLRNPADVAEDALIDLARELNVRYNKLLSLEFIYRAVSINLRKGVVSGLPETQDKAINAVSKALKEVAGGNSTDYDAVAIAIGRNVRKDFQIDLPWRKLEPFLFSPLV